MSDLKTILQQHNLKVTSNRKLILSVFSSKDFALSQNDIEHIINKQLDRVTVYRTLKSFLDKGMIHEVHDGNAQTKYALCNTTECSHAHHQHNHAHFKCENCDKTFCLDNIKIPDIQLPAGYQCNQSSLFIQGVCSSCS